VFSHDDLDAAGIARSCERLHIHRGGVETRLLDRIPELLVEGRQVTTLIGPVGTRSGRRRRRCHLHPFLLHEGVVSALHLPVHTEVPWCLTGDGVVVQDRNVDVNASALAVGVNNDHRGTVWPHLLGQQECQVTRPLQVAGIVDIQFVGMEGQDIGVCFHPAAVLLGQPVARLNELGDARCIAIEPRSQPVGPCRFMALLLRPDTELQIVSAGTQVVDRRHRCDAHGYSFPLSASTMRS
jgi:hypothetical protein